MSNEVIEFLRKEAGKHQFTIFNDVFGRIELNAKLPIKQSSGAVYGVLAYSKTQISGEIKSIPSLENFYPIYWGKDISPIKRIVAHVQNHEGTGNANLRSCEQIQDKDLIFGAIFVSDYKKFEDHLHRFYPSLLGTGGGGRTSTVIEIEN